MIKSIDPLTGEEFIQKRKNQRFASANNRKRFHNDNSTIINRVKAPIDRKLKQNFLLLNKLLKANNDALIKKEDLLIQGFDPNYFTHLSQINGKTARCIYEYILPQSENPDLIKIIRQ
jgi:hypothetical protein